MEEKATHDSTLATWIVILLLTAGIVVAGLFGFYFVGDRGQPSWDFRPAQDVPAESPYAIYEPLPYPQHVKGQKGE